MDVSQSLHSGGPAATRAQPSAEISPRKRVGAARPQDGRVILFATARARPAEASLRRAQSMAELLRARLLLLSVVPEAALRPAWLRGPERLSAIERFVEHARLATGHVRTVLRQRYAEERHALKVGGFFEQTRAYAQELGALMIVLSEREHKGNRVTALARASGLPVLVARQPAGPIRVIVAATALQSEGFPVLRRACELRACCGSELLCVHHPQRSAVRRERLWSSLRSRRARRGRAARRVLSQVCGSLGVEVVMTAPSRDTARATLRLARSADADLIVVGTGVRSPLERALRRSVATRVVDASACSVLVTPLA